MVVLEREEVAGVHEGWQAVEVDDVDGVFTRLVASWLQERAWRSPEPQVPDGAAWAAPGVEPPSTGLSPAVVQAQEAVAALSVVRPSGSPADVEALLRLSQQVAGLALLQLAEMDATGSHAEAGSPTAATWLRDTLHLTDVAAHAQVRLAAALETDLPELGALLRDGATTVEHARAAVAGTRGLDPQLVHDSDEAICALVQATDPATVRAQLRERAEALNPELSRDAERRAHARRGFTVDDVGGTVVLGGSLGVEDGALLLLGLDLAVRADRGADDDRSLRQRRADVVVQWAREAAAQRGGGAVREDLRTTRAQVLLTCTPEQLEAAAGQVDEGTRVPAGGSYGPGALVSSEALRRLVCDASIALAVVPAAPADSNHPLGLRTLGAPAPDPLHVGRAARVVTAAQWRALVVRDRHCIVKGCRRPPTQCQAHHVQHWLDGGTTDLPNLVLLCHQHHHEHHDQHHDLRHRDGRWITDQGWAPQAPP
ncbi:MAG TPA: DUF222 domain-containing protein [Mycobacteriales bacterium]|nr:DUF222 domain-containing protein [Mycobacteriales bacterium]